MNKTTKLGLSLYESNDKFAITASEDSLNHNMDLIDEAIGEIASEKVDNTDISLGIASDGLVYIFINGQPVGSGIARGSGHDVFGYVDENKVIVLSGDIANGNYTVKQEIGRAHV